MEATFKIVFFVVVAAALAALSPAGFALRRRPGAHINQTEHELPSLRVIRPVLGLVFYGALLDWLIPGTRLAWARIPLGVSWRWAGGVVAVLAVLLLWRAVVALGANYRGGIGLWDDHQLVVSGPYRWIRHPIYTAFVLVMLGVMGLSASWLVGLSGLALTSAIPALRLRREEQELAERFGEAFGEYRSSTAGFVPGVF